MLFLVDQAFYQAAAQSAFLPKNAIITEIMSLSILTVLKVSYKANSSLGMKLSAVMVVYY
jgi:hypothetical protein